MLRIAADLSRMALAAGEAFIHEIQLLHANGLSKDVADTSMVLTIYAPGTRETVQRIEYERLTDERGYELFRIARDGGFSESLLATPGLLFEIARRFKQSRKVLYRGEVAIAATSATIPSLDTESIGDVACRTTIKDAAQLGGDPVVTVEYVAYSEAPPPTPPSFLTAPAIGHDGTPAVGETGTITWGTIAGGEWSEREVLRNGVALPEPIGATITFQAGTYRLREVADGPGGETEIFSVAVVVAAITAPAKVGDLPDIYWSVGSGPHPFSIASGFSGEDLVFSVEDAPAGAEYALDPLTGTGILQTDAVADGNMRVRATNAAGYAEQTFPYFIRAEATFTVLAREPNGTVTVESFAEVTPLTTIRNVDGSVTVQEAA